MFFEIDNCVDFKCFNPVLIEKEPFSITLKNMELCEQEGYYLECHSSTLINEDSIVLQVKIEQYVRRSSDGGL